MIQDFCIVMIPDLAGEGQPKIVDGSFCRSIADAKETIRRLKRLACETGHAEYHVIDHLLAVGYFEDDDCKYDWTRKECSCGECMACYKFMRDEDQKWVRTHALY